MDRRVRINGAAFRTDVEDNQFFEFFAGPFGLLRTVTTIDELTISGFEIDASFAMTENLQSMVVQASLTLRLKRTETVRYLLVTTYLRRQIRAVT